MKVKKIITITMCTLICIMAIGYAAFATNLTINGTANITSTWKVLFTKIEEVSKTSGVTITKVPTAEGTNATFNVDLKSPGDKIVYKITVANQGTLDAIINDITASETGSDAIKFEITGIKKGDKLAKSATTTFDVTISYDESVTSQPKTTNNNLTVNINYVQDLGQTITDEGLIIHGPKLVTNILSDNNAQADTNIDFSQISSDTNGKGLYYTSTNTEDNKRTYYFRGDVQNNYVSFGTINYGTCTYKDTVMMNIYNSDGEVTDGYSPEDEMEKWVCPSTTINVCEEYYDNQLMEAHIGLTEEQCLAMNDSNYKTVWTSGKFTFTLKYSEVIMWRIVRINEDGSVRLIKQDALEDEDIAFNIGQNDATYVGYMYGTSGSSTYEATHANTNSSTIKIAIDTWYQNNLISYSSMIADSGFCGDRSLSYGTGIGKSETHYGAYNRLTNNRTPQFACPQSNDLYTTATSIKGNKALTYPIGLITADEVAYAGAAGGYGKNNKDYYLISEERIWTMTPYRSGIIPIDNVWESSVLDYEAFLGGSDVNWSDSVRPVINLKSAVEITSGDGTLNNPYVVKTN